MTYFLNGAMANLLFYCHIDLYWEKRTSEFPEVSIKMKNFKTFYKTTIRKPLLRAAMRKKHYLNLSRAPMKPANDHLYYHVLWIVLPIFYILKEYTRIEICQIRKNLKRVQKRIHQITDQHLYCPCSWSNWRILKC